MGMTLIKSISGIRGTIGGTIGDNLTPVDIVKCVAGFGKWVKLQHKGNVIVIGRDARTSGSFVSQLVSQTLVAMGFDVLDSGYSTTPTVELSVIWQKAAAGIIITASHNPSNWNALKLLNAKGEFVSADEGKEIVGYIVAENTTFNEWNHLGSYNEIYGQIDRHIQSILELPLVFHEEIRAKKYRVAVDCINSAAAISIIPLLEALNCEVFAINDDMSGHFSHNPEPLENHLSELIQLVKDKKADLGVALDPDVDRLVLVDENGHFFGEEYTIVCVADYILSKQPGNTVSNMSSSRALSDITKKHGGLYFPSSVGEVHVVEKMKHVNAVIGGEGNGGVILPELHYGRDALVGMSLILSYMATSNQTISAIIDQYPKYIMIKQKLEFESSFDLDKLFEFLANAYKDERINIEDGLKIDFQDAWVHLRRSNTEPIVRLYAEAKSQEQATELINQLMGKIKLL
jgi:phosphomannomutase